MQISLENNADCQRENDIVHICHRYVWIFSKMVRYNNGMTIYIYDMLVQNNFCIKIFFFSGLFAV